VTGTGQSTLPAYAVSTTKVKTAAPLLENDAAPSITGDATVGQTLTVSPGDWVQPDGSTLAFSYQWKVGGVAVTGAAGTGTTFIVPATAVGKTITVVETASASGYTATSKESDPTSAVVGLLFTVTGSPTYSGTLAVGKTITAVPPTYDPAPTKFTYKWTLGTKVLSTKSTLKIPSSAVGKTITLEITASKTGYQTDTRGDDDIEVPGNVE
jgi:hypothetical protein